MTNASFVPLSALELREAVRNSKRYDPLRLSRVLSVDERIGLIEVQAHTPWRAIADRLRPGDSQAASTRTTMNTVGESIAANAAGPDGRPAVAHVESLTVVTPEGELRRISRHAHRELFALTVGGQGLFAAVYSITLRIDTMARAIAQQTAPEMLAGSANTGHRQALRLLLPPERLDACVHDLNARCEEWRTSPEGFEARQILEEDETYLRWAPREYVEVGIRLGTPASIGEAVRSAQLARDLIDVAIAHGGSFPIASTAQATRAQAEACYPRLREFLAEKRRVDPAERLTNAWYNRYRGLLFGEKVEVRWGQ
jgi:FAD/FMN-containing dehydrogenase